MGVCGKRQENLLLLPKERIIMGYSKEDKRKHLILSCRFYNGEDESPFEKELLAHEIDKSHLPPPECMKDEYTLPADEVARLKHGIIFWHYESMWVEMKLNGKAPCLDSVMQEYKDYGMDDFATEDGTPYDLKVLLFNRYYHWSGMLDRGGSEFRKFYLNYYQPTPTNRERRAESRRPHLIAKCRYYKGEETNPLENTPEGMFWFYEECWVNELSRSYHAGDGWRKVLAFEIGKDFNKEDGVPQSLKGLLLDRYLHWAVMGSFDKERFIQWYKERYLKEKV